MVQAESGYYLVSAYYSPEPGQDFYLHGTYEDEVRINGEGIHTASGEKVRIGAIAAPSTISFGSRLSIDQELTIQGQKVQFSFTGTVLDRGGAITTASHLPRLDIYMGSGQEGLCRAINFWVQTVYANFNDVGTSDTSSFGMISSDCVNPNSVFVTPTTFDPFKSVLSSQTSSDDIKTIQRLFQRVGIENDINGVYDTDFKNTVFDFQIQYDILDSWDDDGAGNYWPITRATLKSVLEGNIPVSENISPVSNTSEWVIVDEDESEEVDNVASIYTWWDNENIRELQRMLKDMGYFSFDVDGLYNKRLTDAIYLFQKDRGIVSSPDDIGAGYYGPVTRSTLAEAYIAWEINRDQRAELEADLISAREYRDSLLHEKKVWFVSMLDVIPMLQEGQVHPEIRTLQILLKDLGYLDHKDTAIFGPLTKDALAHYQLDLGMIDSLNSPYAGMLGNRTKSAIASDLFDRWAKVDVSGMDEIKRIENELAKL